LLNRVENREAARIGCCPDGTSARQVGRNVHSASARYSEDVGHIYLEAELIDCVQFRLVDDRFIDELRDLIREGGHRGLHLHTDVPIRSDRLLYSANPGGSRTTS